MQLKDIILAVKSKTGTLFHSKDKIERIFGVIFSLLQKLKSANTHETTTNQSFTNVNKIDFQKP